MAKKASTGTNGSGSQDDKTPQAGGAGTGGATDDEEEEEEEEEELPPPDKSKGGDGKPDDGKGKGKQDELDLSKLDDETQRYIKQLRRENAKYRTKATNLETNYNQLTDRVKKIAGGKDGEEDAMSAEERLAAHEQQSGALAFDNAVMNAALEHGVGKSDLKYFRFLVNEKASVLGEGEELTDEDLADIAEEARRTTGGERKRTKTSVTGKEDGRDGSEKRPDGKDKVDLDKFCKMNMYQKADFQRQNPELYADLFKEAVKNRRLV